MSASYWLEIDTGGDEPLCTGESINVTYNLGPMLRAAGFPIWERLRGAPASETASMLAGVAERLRANKDQLVAEHSPANGWGDWKWAVEFVDEFHALCVRHPKCTVGASL